MSIVWGNPHERSPVGGRTGRCSGRARPRLWSIHRRLRDIWRMPPPIWPGGLSCPLPPPASRGAARGGCPCDDDRSGVPPCPPASHEGAREHATPRPTGHAAGAPTPLSGRKSGQVASEKPRHALYAIGQRRGLDRATVQARVHQQLGKAVEALTSREASGLTSRWLDQ
jgi:hypothetical protein